MPPHKQRSSTQLDPFTRKNTEGNAMKSQIAWSLKTVNKKARIHWPMILNAKITMSRALQRKRISDSPMEITIMMSRALQRKRISDSLKVITIMMSRALQRKRISDTPTVITTAPMMFSSINRWTSSVTVNCTLCTILILGWTAAL